jgi:hypothetical protein
MTVRDTAERAHRAVLTTMPVAARRRLLYARAQRRAPRFARPQRFTEKVNWRILNDRRPGLAWTCDKLAMKDYAQRSGMRVARTLWSGTDVREISDLELPERWVLKPNHRSATVHLGVGDPDIEKLLAVTDGWLRSEQAERLGEWAYGQARPLMLLEEWIGESEEPPMDYKFFVFDGRVALAQVDTSRFNGHCRRLFRPDWTPVEVTLRWPPGPEVARPERLAEMVEAASVLGAPFDFMRIDLYDDGDAIWFGETTPYPSGGLSRFDPSWLDRELGALWTLPDQAAGGAR